MATQTPAIPIATRTEWQEIKIVSHSNLFYWWPVWAVGFVMALLTWFDGHLMAIVPKDTIARRNATITADKTYDHRDVLIVPEGEKLPPRRADDPTAPPL